MVPKWLLFVPFATIYRLDFCRKDVEGPFDEMGPFEVKIDDVNIYAGFRYRPQVNQ